LSDIFAAAAAFRDCYYLAPFRHYFATLRQAISEASARAAIIARPELRYASR
jgi:hypothetical protein